MIRYGFLGGGKMAEGIICALLESGNAAARDILVAERVQERAKALAERYSIAVTPSIEDVARDCAFVFLAVRPQDAAEVASRTREILSPSQTLVSIVAGRQLKWLASAFACDGAIAPRIVRVMPNLALRVGEGMCAVTSADSAAADEVAAILAAAGKSIVLDEKHFDAVTALSGSGPAFFAYMLAAMAEGGEALGLDKTAARLLAEQTMFGTAKFLRTSGADLEKFIASVATKGGTTAAGMAALEQGGDFKRIVAETLAAAAKRSSEL